MDGGQYQAALQELKALADKPGKDQLVHVLDYALALQINNQIEESNKYFLLADQLVNDNDYYSISKITSSVLLNEEMLQYKGDLYEKLLINAMLMINFSVLGKQESALVEAKKALNKIESLKIDYRIKQSFLPFIYYLNAIMWEANKEWDDAYIDYMNAYKANSETSFFDLQYQLYKTAQLSGREQAAKKWQNTFKSINNEIPTVPQRNKQAEIIVIYQHGWGPRKYPSRRDVIVPVLKRSISQHQQGFLVVESANKQMKTQTVMDVETASIKALEIQMAPLIAKRIAAIASKKVLSHQVYKKDAGLGVLTDLILSVSERADLRQWSLLPQSIQVARVSVPPGEHTIKFARTSLAKNIVCEFPKIVIKTNEKKVLNCRGF